MESSTTVAPAAGQNKPVVVGNNPAGDQRIASSEATGPGRRLGNWLSGRSRMEKIAAVVIVVPMMVVAGWMAGQVGGDRGDGSAATPISVTTSDDRAFVSERARIEAIRRAVATAGDAAAIVALCDAYLADAAVIRGGGFRAEAERIRAEYAAQLPRDFLLAECRLDLAALGEAFGAERAAIWRSVGEHPTWQMSLRITIIDLADSMRRHQILLTPYRRDAVSVVGSTVVVGWAVGVIGTVPPEQDLRGRRWQIEVSLRAISEIRPGQLPDSLTVTRDVPGDWFSAGFHALAADIAISHGVSLVLADPHRRH